MRYWVLLLLYVSHVWGENLPSELSKTGLYKDIVKKEVSLLNHIYSPQYPLWTDGALKRRWVYLPEGKKIATEDPDAWVFPVGTKFWKEFSFPMGEKTRRVETRLMEKTSEEEWSFGTYLWNEAETEATLASENGVLKFYKIKEGVSHSIPSVTECQRCHRKNGDGILGFDALQLSNDRDLNALHGEKLESGSLLLKDLLDQKLLTHAAEEFKGGFVKIPAVSPVGRSVYGYFHSNCASCHNPLGSALHVKMNLASSVLSETEEMLSPFQSLVEKKCVVFQFPHEPKGIRVVKGAPEKSVLFRMMQSHGTERMPNLGSAIHDVGAIEKIREWIKGL